MAEVIMRKSSDFKAWYRFYLLGLKNKKARKLFHCIKELERD